MIVTQYDGHAARLWSDAQTGAELLKRIKALPGFGQQKAQILVALLGKQYGVQPAGWREAAGHYGEDGSASRSRTSWTPTRWPRCAPTRKR